MPAEFSEFKEITEMHEIDPNSLVPAAQPPQEIVWDGWGDRDQFYRSQGVATPTLEEENARIEQIRSARADAPAEPQQEDRWAGWGKPE